MKKILGIAVAVAAVAALAWVLFESREGGRSSSAAPPETPAPRQAAGASFTYDFDGDTAGQCPRNFMPRAPDKEPKASGP